MVDIQFTKRMVILNGIVPLAILVWDAWYDKLGANRVNYAIHVTGILALVFLVASLVVTPLRRLTGWNSLIAYRRALGLYGFFYAVVHLAIYVVLDRAGNLMSTWSELTTRRYLQVGLASILLMIPLAVSSTDGMIRRIGPKRWKLLHRIAYVAITLGGLHYLLLVKSDIRQPVAFLSLIGGLLVARIGSHYFDLRRAANTLRAVPKGITTPAKNAKLPSPKRFWRGQLRIACIFQETDDVKTFRFVAPDGGHLPFNFEPGQYINLRVTIDGKMVARSYTIASSPTRRDYCEVTIKREPSGIGSRFIHDHWLVGDLVEVSAPAGKFFFNGQNEESVVLIGGGVGVTPVMSMLRYLTDRGWNGTIHFFFVIKTSANWIFEEELLYLANRFANLHLHVFRTRDDLTSHPYPFSHGRLTPVEVQRLVPSIASQPVYLCGPDRMMEHTKSLLHELRVPADRIHTEVFASTPNIPVTESSEAEANVALIASLPAGATLPLTIREHQEVLEVAREETILEAAERCQVDIPFECRSGICGQCKIKLCEGTVRMEQTFALTPPERNQGWILACQSHLTSAATIELDPR